MKERRVSEKARWRLIYEVTFSNGHTTEYVTDYRKQPHVGHEFRTFDTAARAEAWKTAAATGLTVASTRVHEEKETVETVERSWSKRKLVEDLRTW